MHAVFWLSWWSSVAVVLVVVVFVPVLVAVWGSTLSELRSDDRTPARNIGVSQQRGSKL